MRRKNKDRNHVPFDPDKVLISDKSVFSIKESYKTLRTNVTFSLPGEGCKTIGVMSASRGDGKSCIALNLAITFSQINKRVVVLDCDMRLPTIASKLGLKQKPGLSNFLAGECTKVPIQVDHERNIDVITAGNIPPDPTILLESSRMQSLITALKEYYDYIIFDFPPIMAVSDAAILSNVIDGYIMIVRHNVSELSKIEESMRQLRFADAKIIGFVYNGKDVTRKYYKRGYNNYYYKQ